MLTGFYVLYYIFLTGNIITLEEASSSIGGIFSGIVNFIADLLTHFESGVSIEPVANYIAVPFDSVVFICALVTAIGFCVGLVALCKKIMSLWLLR